MPLPIGHSLANNRYRIDALLGQGGFGAVYKAWDSNVQGYVALKESFGSTLEEQAQFRLEANLLFKMKHNHLPRVHDCFVEPMGGMYLVEDFIEGENLWTALNNQGHPLPEQEVLRWVKQVCDALAYVHSQNPPVIHRDIKPENIRIDQHSQAFLVDFGIAKVYDRYLKTVKEAQAVTPGYSPAEQYGHGNTDARSDIYSLGATLYTLLTGQVPTESVSRSPSVNLVEPRSINSVITPRTNRVILKAMEFFPEDRYQSAVGLERDLLTGSQAFTFDKLLLPLVAGLAALVLMVFGAIFLVFPSVTALIQSFWKDNQSVIVATSVLTPEFVTPAGPVLTAQTTSNAGLPETITPGGALPASPEPVDVPMVLIPAGEFQMGNDAGNADERPKHTVYLDAFYIDIYEVTNALYRQCVDAGACLEPEGFHSTKREAYFGNPEFDQYPVLRVNWEKAQAYCEWRGGALPSEAQWEKAARGGEQANNYPWGNDWPVCGAGASYGAQYADCPPNDTVEVGLFAPNPFGLYDMAGNVWEWTIDWYAEGYYDVSPGENPAGPDRGIYRVVRGGSFKNDSAAIQISNRSRDQPDDKPLTIGIRCVRPVSASGGGPSVSPAATEAGETGLDAWKQGKLVYALKQRSGSALLAWELASQTEPMIVYENPGRISAPAISPSGRLIAFHILGGDLSVIEPIPGATSVWTSNCLAAAWSSDGSQMICTPSVGNSIQLMDASDGATIDLIPLSSYAFTPAWSPTADEIAYAVKTDDGTRIERLSLRDRSIQILADLATENYSPSYSPDGRWIAYQSTQGSGLSEIWVMARDGSQPRRITYTPEGFWSRAPTWSPDGAWIAYVSNQDAEAAPDYGEVYLISVATGDVTRLTNTGGNVYDWRVSWGN